MSRLPQLKRLVAEDFPDQKAWIRPLFSVINSFMESVVATLDRAVTVSENLEAEIKTVTFTSVPTASNPVTLSWGFTASPTALVVGNIVGATLSNAVSIQWTYGGEGLRITNLIGVTPTSTSPISLTLVCFTR